MESGVVRLTGRAGDLLGDPEVARLYLGASRNLPGPAGSAPTDAAGHTAASPA
jgi:hypothetical protein